MFKSPSELVLDDESAATKEDVSDVCRICLNDGNIPIFGDPSVAEDIINFSRIHMSEDDGLPQHICNQCHELLASAIHFTTLAIESDKILRQRVTSKECFETDSDDNLSDTDPWSKAEDSSDITMDHNLSDDTSSIYLECKNSENEVDTEASKGDSSDEGEGQQIDPKDVYMVIVSDKKTNSGTGFHCELCNLAFNTLDEGNKHFSTHELGSCKKCVICNNIMDINVYEIHMKLHKEAYKQRKAKSNIQCKICGKVVGKTYLKFHMKLHGTEKDKTERTKKCPICDKLVSYYYFSSHIKRIHGNPGDNFNAADEKVKKCPICDRSFKEKHYQKHLAGHGNRPKQYICDQCGREFKHYSAFQTHLLTHGGELKYKCQFCPYRGLHLGLLKVHVRTHTKDYLYECSTCNKKFLTKSNLSMHERRHKTPNSFICPVCNRGFYAKRNLDKHYNMIHLGIRNEKCEICGKAFGHRDGLLSHQNKVHNREKSTHKGRLPNYLRAEQAIQNNTDVEEN